MPRTEEEPSGYDVSWLGNNVGWLQDTAFPGRLDGGNAVLTGHVVNYDGKSGPFIALECLQYGDQIMIEAFGERYTYLVTDVMVVARDNFEIMEPTKQPTLTLLTCKYFNEETNQYDGRIAVKALLDSVSLADDSIP